jgi:hypothetical protein
MLIIMQLEIIPPRTISEARHNYKKTKWEEFRKTLEDSLGRLPEPEEINTIERFHTAIEQLDVTIKAAVEKHVPMTKHSPYSKRWWSKGLAEAKRKKERLARISYKRRAADRDPIHEMFRQARNDYSLAIRNAKADHWSEWLESLDGEGVWTANRMVTGPATDGGRSRVPTLQIKDSATRVVIQEAHTNKEKGELFYQTFFPPRTAAPAPAPNEPYPQPRWEYQSITDEQIQAPGSS